MKRILFCIVAVLAICTMAVAQPAFNKVEQSIPTVTKVEKFTGSFSFEKLNTSMVEAENFIKTSYQSLKGAGWNHSTLEIVAVTEKSITFNVVGTMVLNTYSEYCGTTNWLPGQCNGCEQAYTAAQLMRLNFLAQGYQYVCIMPPHNSPEGCETGFCGWTTCYQVVASNDWNCELQ